MLNAAKPTQETGHPSAAGVRSLKALVLLLGMVLCCYAIVAAFSRGPSETHIEFEIESEPVSSVETQYADSARFTHGNQSHARLPCLICHRRDDNSPRITFPGKVGHAPCAGCHAVEFSGNTSSMCTICHTDTGMKRFPGLRSFGLKFNHGRHTRVNCAVCHKSRGTGVAKTIPSGTGAHTTCFQCHSANSSNSMASCGTCHTPGKLVRTPESAVSFRKGFSHAEHAGKARLNCAACHTVRASAPRGKEVSSPLPSMHFAPARSLSCGGCHNEVRAFGAEDFANCKKCHGTKTFKF